MNENAEHPQTPFEPFDIEQRIIELQRKIDEREDKIRRLNEALAIALTELQLDEAA